MAEIIKNNAFLKQLKNIWNDILKKEAQEHLIAKYDEDLINNYDPNPKNFQKSRIAWSFIKLLIENELIKDSKLATWSRYLFRHWQKLWLQNSKNKAQEKTQLRLEELEKRVQEACVPRANNYYFYQDNASCFLRNLEIHNQFQDFGTNLTFDWILKKWVCDLDFTETDKNLDNFWTKYDLVAFFKYSRLFLKKEIHNFLFEGVKYEHIYRAKKEQYDQKIEAKAFIENGLDYWQEQQKKLLELKQNWEAINKDELNLFSNENTENTENTENNSNPKTIKQITKWQFNILAKYNLIKSNNIEKSLKSIKKHIDAYDFENSLLKWETNRDKVNFYLKRWNQVNALYALVDYREHLKFKFDFSKNQWIAEEADYEDHFLNDKQPTYNQAFFYYAPQFLQKEALHFIFATIAYDSFFRQKENEKLATWKVKKKKMSKKFN